MQSPSPNQPLSRTKKQLLSCVIVAYLVVLVLGPLSNPIGSEHLARPLARFVAPIHRALFLGHGYRFFAPDPGPSHLVEFRITKSNGESIVGHFPDASDRDSSFPRLQYHRWFMLSETIWSEHSSTRVRDEFLALQKRSEELATEKQIAGNHALASTIRADMEKRKIAYELARTRIDELVKSVAKGLLDQHGGNHIRLSVRERIIPYPADVQEGIKLDDPRFLKPEQASVIGEFTASELAVGGEQ